MAIKYQPCEPFHKYTRIEGRPRETELDDALAAKIHDPLWMLSRQYQFGEFQGEDAGSAVFAKMALNRVNLAGFRRNGNPFKPVNHELPLEATVEKLIPKIDHKMSYRIGKLFLEMLGVSAEGVVSWPADEYRTAMIARFPFVVPEPDPTALPGSLAASFRERSLREAVLFLRTVAGRGLNGAAIWAFLNGDPSRLNALVANPGNGSGFIDPGHAAILINTGAAWITRVRELWNIPATTQEQAWIRERMEYSFELSVDEGNSITTELKADEYHHGHLDWFSFDVGKAKPVSNSHNATEDLSVVREVKTVIPVQASFKGMPNDRWWTLEDSSVDIGNLSATDTDVAAVLVSQYALHYSNDWLMIPCDVPVGSMVDVEGIVVTSTFGDKTLVEPAHKKTGSSWKDWTMYSMTVRGDSFDPGGIEQRLFLPPSAVKVLEGEPVEQVKLVRDEMANMVWGIEKIVPDGLGSGTDGYELAAIMEAFCRKLEEAEVPPVPDSILVDNTPANTPHLAETTKPQLKYTLGNTVTENWIPFIPVHIKNSNREIHLQRASMPRICEVVPPHQVRPRTPLLRDGIRDDDTQETPFYLFEEEVPRAGATVTGAWQRTRWYNGKSALWYGRKKSTGRGEGSSGLRFDYISDNF
jgi:hypothetical protein